MRLLCLKTDQVHCFSEKVPPYAILSPSWGDGNDDITWKGGVFHGPELLSRDNLECVRRICSGLEVEWLWVDTRCIDRSCHAELTEAINSMFRWYQQSQACFVYLDDFSYDASECQSNDLQELLSLCRWFRRGWTLQELIAPHTIKFFAPDWSQIGTKKSLVSQISKITGIDEPVLHDPACFGDYSAARCFSWVARLPCSLEDSTAHALAGLFGVSIAILDEQDGTAFFRLQEMIWNKTRDASVFAWCLPGDYDHDSIQDYQEPRGLFGHNLSEFAHFSDGALPLAPLYVQGDIVSTSSGWILSHASGVLITGDSLVLGLGTTTYSKKALAKRRPILGLTFKECNGYFSRCTSQDIMELAGWPTDTIDRLCFTRDSGWLNSKLYSQRKSEHPPEIMKENYMVPSAVKQFEGGDPTAQSRSSASNIKLVSRCSTATVGEQTSSACTSPTTIWSFDGTPSVAQPLILATFATWESNASSLSTPCFDKHFGYYDQHTVDFNFSALMSCSGSKPSYITTASRDSSQNYGTRQMLSSGFDANNLHRSKWNITPVAAKRLKYVDSDCTADIEEEDMKENTAQRNCRLNGDGDDDDDMEVFTTPPIQKPQLDHGHPYVAIKDDLVDCALKIFPLYAGEPYFFSSKRLNDAEPGAVTKKRRRSSTSSAPPAWFCAHIKDGVERPNREREEEEATDGDETVVIRYENPYALFACPFYRRNPELHKSCLTSLDTLETIRDVKQHLWTHHRRPYYCSVCWTIFTSADDCDQHVRDLKCSPQVAPAEVEGIDDDQVKQLAVRPQTNYEETSRTTYSQNSNSIGRDIDYDDTGGCVSCDDSNTIHGQQSYAVEEQWLHIWEIIFPGLDKPSPLRPYLGGNLETLVCHVRGYWARQGRELIADFLEKRNLREYAQVPNEEHNLEALYFVVLEEMMEAVVQGFASAAEDSQDNSSSPTGSSIGSMVFGIWRSIFGPLKARQAF